MDVKMMKIKDKTRNRKKLNKKAQVTIYIIIAIIFIAVIVFLVSLRKKPIIEKHIESDPSFYIEKCVKDSVLEAIDIMLPQGGYVNPTNYKLYEGNKAAYLCYNKNYYQTCINQVPLYIQHLEKEIEDDIRPKTDICFYSLKQDFGKRNYDVAVGDSMNIEVELAPKVVKVKIARDLTLNKGGETREFKEFKTKFSSPLYDLANIAREIVNQEAKYCNFEYIGYSMLYPKFKIDKKAVGSASDSSKIYIIEDKATGKKLYFAIRSCAIPPGF